MASRSSAGGGRAIREKLTVVAPNAFGANLPAMEQTRDEIFDDASGDLAIGELEKAVKKYRRCIELDPEFFDGWHALGMALMKIGQFPEAIEAGKKATA